MSTWAYFDNIHAKTSAGRHVIFLVNGSFKAKTAFSSEFSYLHTQCYVFAINSCCPHGHAFGVQASDKEAADNPVSLSKRSVDGSVNYQTAYGDGKTSAALDDDSTETDDEDMIDYIRAKQRHCVNEVCAAVASKFSNAMDVATCAFHYCSAATLASSAQSVVVSSPTKRWGSRLCMEIHCRSLEHDISSYVNCGVRHCTK
jgi:hypothetical protein